MKVNELMVGDLLRVNHDGLLIKKDSIVQVRGIDMDNKFEEMGHFGCVSCRPIDKKQFSEGIWLDYLEPIPITPEILEKNGFKNGELNVSPQYFLEDGHIFIGVTLKATPDRQEGVTLCKNINSLQYEGKIEFVHELQHALRLCGIDKEIVV